MFISSKVTDQHGECYYIAEPAKRGNVRQYVWRRVPHHPGPERILDPTNVPEPIRERAYNLFERDRLRERR